MRCLATLAALLLLVVACHADEVLRPLQQDAKRGPNLLGNPGFEQLENGKPVGWANQLADSWTADNAVCHSGKASLRCAKAGAGTLYWLSYTVALNQTRPKPLVVSGWSKAENAQGTQGGEYSVWVDLQYTDGTPLWGQKAPFEPGTHDWQYAEKSFVVTKPVRSAQVNLLFRNGFSGTVWFDDLALQELDTGAGLIFDRSSATQAAAAKPGIALTTLRTADRLELGLDARGRVAGLKDAGQSLLGDAPGGFWLRDVKAGGPWVRPDCQREGAGPEIVLTGSDRATGLKLEQRWTTTDDGIDCHATVTDLTGTDRAVTAYFVLPLAERGWTWHDDLNHSAATTPGSEYLNAGGWPISGISSVYPFASLTSREAGLSLSVPMDCPRVFRLAYNSTLSVYYVAVNLGLSKETANFPSQGDFRFSLSWHDPQWGFRAAVAKYYQRHPEYFVRRLNKGGIWMAFANISKVRDWQDFGFAYDENSATPLQFDNDNGIASFRYIEPMTYWLPMRPEQPRTYDGALQALRDNLAKGNDAQKQSARATLRCGTFTREGKYDLSLQNQAWCDGAVFTLNPDPSIAEDAECPLNKGRMGYTPEWADKNLMQKSGPRLDGIYLDSMPNWGEVRNYRREHWRTVTVPLTFDPETHDPVLLQMFSTWQYAKWIADDVHRRGGVMHGNGGALWPFFPALLDITGQEMGGILSDSAMAMARTLLRNKPYSPLLNTEFAKLPPDYMERYFHACALYDIFPSFFNGDVFVDGKWKTTRFFDVPELYDRARPLYQQFLPILRRMYAAGWEPVTLAKTNTPGVQLERYGSPTGGEVLLALYNSGKEPVQAAVTADAALKLPDAARASTLVKPSDLTLIRDGAMATFTVPLAAGRCEVVRLGN